LLKRREEVWPRFANYLLKGGIEGYEKEGSKYLRRFVLGLKGSEK
jgi:hypothetical protein